MRLSSTLFLLFVFLALSNASPAPKRNPIKHKLFELEKKVKPEDSAGQVQLERSKKSAEPDLKKFASLFSNGKKDDMKGDSKKPTAGYSPNCNYNNAPISHYLQSSIPAAPYVVPTTYAPCPSPQPQSPSCCGGCPAAMAPPTPAPSCFGTYSPPVQFLPPQPQQLSGCGRCPAAMAPPTPAPSCFGTYSPPVQFLPPQSQSPSCCGGCPAAMAPPTPAPSCFGTYSPPVKFPPPQPQQLSGCGRCPVTMGPPTPAPSCCGGCSPSAQSLSPQPPPFTYFPSYSSSAPFPPPQLLSLGGPSSYYTHSPCNSPSPGCGEVY